jgi:serine/threonine-protein kinase RsbW
VSQEPLPFHLNPEKLKLKLEFALPADTLAISPVVEEIMRGLQDTPCVAGSEFEVETALREALANAIVHGAKNDPSKQVECWVACDEEKCVVIMVRDPGPGFDPKDVPSPLMGENLHSNHGRGIFLINELMDEVRFEKNGTEIHMRKRS